MANSDDESLLSEQEKRERNAQNNANTLRNAAEVAVASGEAHAVAIGEAVKLADKATGGKSTELLGKGLERANRYNPGGKMLQGASNKLAESGLGDKIGKGASMYNGMSGQGAPGGQPGSVPSGGMNLQGGGQDGSLPSSSGMKPPSGGATDANASGPSDSGVAGVRSSNKGSILGDEDSSSSSSNKKNNDSENGSSGGVLKFTGKMVIKIALMTFGPLIILLFVFFLIIAFVAGIFSDYDDAFGISQTVGEDTGELYYESSNPEQQAYFDRIKDIKLRYQASGKSVDALKIVATFHVLNNHGAGLDYPDITESKITQVVDAMFDGNSYSESKFKENLIKTIIPKYLPSSLDEEREEIVNEIFYYIEDYYDIIGKQTSSGSCASSGSCSYDIKGFYINGRGNVAKNMQISNLKVRLMECGGKYGTGSYTKAIDQPLVDFEDYVGGVAYAEIGTGAPAEAIKAQLVAARSFALARPTEMGNSLGKKLEEENGQWVLQIASCVSDQVFCNINEGCSYMGGGDGQGGIVRSGKIAGAWRTRDPLPEDHPLRTYMKETEGEVLVNDQGYIIETGFDSSDQNSFSDLANQGLNYKQILLQFYNSGRRPYHASDIVKASCGGGGSSNCGVSSGEFASWKQFGAPWSGVAMGGSNIGSVGCLVTSIAIQIAKSGVDTILDDFNPGTFVAYLNSHGAFGSGGGLGSWASPSMVAPNFQYVDTAYISGYSREQKLQTISNILNDGGYPVCEVKGGHGQHWVAIDAVQGDKIVMMDPGSNSTDLWEQYPWSWTSKCVIYKVNG